MTQWKSTIGVVSGVISSTESESEESERFHFFRFRLRLRRLWSSENWVVGVGSRSGRTNQSQGPESNIVIGLFFRFCLRLRQCSFHLIVSDGVISRISIVLPTPSVWFSLDRIALRFWLRLRLRLRRKWKPAFTLLRSFHMEETHLTEAAYFVCLLPFYIVSFFAWKEKTLTFFVFGGVSTAF